MSIVAHIIARDLRHAFTHGSALLPMAFFLLVAALYPFAVGPDAPLLSRTGGGIIWVAALLAALLPLERLVAKDIEAGVIDQLALRGISDEIIALAKMIAHWLGFAPPLMAAAIPGAALLGLSANMVWRVEVGLLIATPGLAALAVMIAGITAGLRGASALGGMLMLPLAVPLLIFGAAMLDPAGQGAAALLGATSLFLCAIAPFAAGAALRGARD